MHAYCDEEIKAIYFIEPIRREDDKFDSSFHFSYRLPVFQA
jgi:hypothetical protein